MREFQFNMVEIQEKCRVEDFNHEGPRPLNFSVEPEIRCQPIHSFKNSEASVWQHAHDILLSTEVMTTDFMCDLRNSAAVSIFLNLVTFHLLLKEFLYELDLFFLVFLRFKLIIQQIIGDFCLCQTLYEVMLKKMDHFPESIAYFPNLPAHLRHRVFKYLDGQLPKTDTGKVLVRPLFEKILTQILAKDYGDATYSLSPMKISLRSACVVDLISMCKFHYKVLKDFLVRRGT